MSRRLLWSLLPLAACASPPPRCPAPEPAVAQVSPPPVASSASASPAPAASSAPPRRAESPCWARGRPAERAQKKKTPREYVHCLPLEGAEMSRVEAEIRKRLVIHRKPSKLVIDFGCDLASEEPSEVFFESGSGHGGTLRIVRVVREPSGWKARDLRVRVYMNKGIDVTAATLDTGRFNAAIASARVAALARPHLIDLVNHSGSMSMSGSSSSRDFHLRLTLQDDENHATDNAFTGYESSDEQEKYIPMELAAAPIEKALSASKWQAVDATDDDRKWLTRRFLATMAGDPYWWVKERYVAALAALGTVDALPALAALAGQKGDASVERTREAAVAAVAAITGWDAREGGRSVEEAAALVARECALPAAQAEGR